MITTYRINVSLSQAKVTDQDIEAKIFAYVIIFFMYTISIFLFIDNLIFHKSFKAIDIEESIEDIGRSDFSDS